jgi:hypothetical protein
VKKKTRPLGPSKAVKQLAYLLHGGLLGIKQQLLVIK